MKATEVSIVENGAQGLQVGNAEPEHRIHQMSATLELITPQKAAQWSSEAADNRKMSEDHSDQFAGMLRSGEIYVINQGIGLDYNGRCIDGQHRLRAIVKTGISVWMTVVRGMDPNAFRAIDAVRVRRFRDDLSAERRHKYSEKAAFASQTLRYERGARRGYTLSMTQKMQLNRMELADALDQYELNEDIEYLLKTADKTRKSVGAPGSGVSAAYYLALQYKTGAPDTASYRAKLAVIDEYFEKLASGFEISQGEPVGALRHGIQRRKKEDNSNRIDPAETVSGILYCLDKTLKGEKIRKLPWTAVRDRKPQVILS